MQTIFGGTARNEIVICESQNGGNDTDLVIAELFPLRRCWTNQQKKGGLFRVRPLVFGAKRVCCMQCLFGGEFFLFAFHAHGFELALFGFVGFLTSGLDLGCRFLELG